MNTKDTPIKSFDKVKIGDIAYENPTAGNEYNNKQGTIIWKGSYGDLLNSKYKDNFKYTIKEMEEDDTIKYDYDWVIVDEPKFGITLFNYDCDPSGVVVFMGEGKIITKYFSSICPDTLTDTINEFLYEKSIGFSSADSDNVLIEIKFMEINPSPSRVSIVYRAFLIYRKC